MIRTLLIRADGNAAIGSGHIMRCLALAQAWQAAEGAVIFAVASVNPALHQRVSEQGCAIIVVDASIGSESDAEQTRAAALKSGAEWIVADGYHFGADWQKSVRAGGNKLLLLDDYGHSDIYSADLILNQNASANESFYAQRATHTQLLLGPQYVLLRSEFTILRDFRRESPPVARKVLVTLGGGDPDNVTATVIRALDKCASYDAVVVVGGSNPHLTELRTLVAERSTKMRLVVDATNMPELMSWADVAVAAAGSTTWELAYLGLPALLIVIAENQRGIAAELQRRGVSRNLGDFRAVTESRIAESLTALLSDQSGRQAMSAAGPHLIDGYGASRVTAALGRKLSLTLVSDQHSWLNALLPDIERDFAATGHKVRWVHSPAEIDSGDVAFFLSLSQLVAPPILRRHAHNLVVHESALPAGRGWSPLTWQILEGKNDIPVTLIEAANSVDSGAIYSQRVMHFRGDELLAELRAQQAAATLELCREFVARYPAVCAQGRPQTGAASYYPRRRPEDSRLDANKSLVEQFNLLRVTDHERYPAFVEIGGKRFNVQLTPAS
jgi:UDP-2,4-diacetamido-2,4,6-trideoxy-beta-L-altropyranose hydrolase